MGKANNLLLVTEFFDVQAGEVSPFNLAAAVLGFFTGLAIAVFGAQEGSLAIMGIGIVFTVSIPVAIVFTGFSLVTGRGSFGDGAVSFLAAQLPWLVPGILASSFSLFSSPTGSYLSVLANTPLYIQILTNVVIAPINETFLFAGLAVIIYKILEVSGWEEFTSVLTVTGLLAIGFAFLHGARSIEFIILAMIFMGATLLFILGEGTGTFDVPLFDMTLSAAIGAHFANNVAASGGYQAVVNALLSAPEPYLWIGYVVVGFLAITVFAAAARVVQLVFGGSR